MKRLGEQEVNRLLEEVEKSYGIKLKVEGKVLLMTGENKIRITTEETFAVSSRLRGVMNVGLYIIKRRKNFPSLTIESCLFVETSEFSRVVELSKDQAYGWMKGDPVKVGPMNSKTVLGQYLGHCLGSAVVDVTGTAYPQVPKWRRLPPTVI